MKNIWLIIRRELGSYIRTPSGYIIAASVLLLNGLLFNTQAVGSEPKFSSEVLQDFFFWAGGLTIVAGVMFSMRLLSEERAKGTQVLLFTSPIKEEEVVLGKFFSSVIFLSLLTLLTLYLPSLIFINGKVSWGHIASGYIGMILLGSSTLALGVFATSLVGNQFLGVLLTAVFSTVMFLCWYLAKITEPPLSDSIEYMSPFMSHFGTSFMLGIVKLSDVVFFLSVMYLSLLAAVRVLKSQRWQ